MFEKRKVSFFDLPIVMDESMKNFLQSVLDGSPKKISSSELTRLLKLSKKMHRESGYSKKRGRPFSGKAPNPQVLYHLYTDKHQSIRKIADTVGCSKDIIHRALQRYRITLRPNVRYSKLKKFSMKQIEWRIKLRGLRGAAIYFGVHHTTLLHYLKGNRKQEGGRK